MNLDKPLTHADEWVLVFALSMFVVGWVILAAFGGALQWAAVSVLALMLGRLLWNHRGELAPRWKHIEDLDRPGDIYLSRLFLVKRQWIGVYLHIIRRDDWSRCQHDHPWAFATLILAGGYEEEVGGKRYVRRPGYFGYRPRSFEHRITELLTGRAITLVVRFYDHVDWNFRTIFGKMPWLDYIRQPNATRVLWCDDRPEVR